jgi:signal recognition particle GTPase
MIKLTNILTELLNTYSVDAFIKSNRKFAITDILNQIRAVRKITTVRNITPENYPQTPDIETTKVSIKFISRGEARIDIEKFKEDIETSDMSSTDLRIPGVKVINFKPETLKRL